MPFCKPQNHIVSIQILILLVYYTLCLFYNRCWPFSTTGVLNWSILLQLVSKDALKKQPHTIDVSDVPSLGIRFFNAKQGFNFIQSLEGSKICSIFSVIIWNSIYLKEDLVGFIILSGRTSSTHSFGLDFMRSQKATSEGVESIQSTSAP